MKQAVARYLLMYMNLGLLCGGRLKKEGVAWEAQGESHHGKAQSQILGLLSFFSIVHHSISESRRSHNSILGLSCMSKKCA